MEVTFDGGKVITAHLNGQIIKTDQPLENGGAIQLLHRLICFSHRSAHVRGFM
jgi:hypothetical protein